MEIKHSDGTTTGLGEPTMLQRQLDETKKTNAKVDACAAKADKTQREKEAARVAALPKPDARFQTILLGVTRMHAKCKRSGEAVKADRLVVLADRMAVALADYRVVTEKLEAKRPTPLADAIAAAASELAKKLPGCFGTLADAEVFAGQYLPLVSARQAQGIENDRFAKIAKARGKAKDEFWAAASQGAFVATGSRDDRAVKILEDMGSL